MFSLFNGPRSYPRFYAPYYEDFNFYDGREEWLRSISAIPLKAVHLFALHWLHLEVRNGGFWQYFFNSTSTSFPEAESGFRAIGMPEVADLVQSAAFKLGQPFPFERDTRKQIVGMPDDRMDFDELDCRFYDLADTNKIFRKIPKFVPFADAYAAAT